MGFKISRLLLMFDFNADLLTKSVAMYKKFKLLYMSGKLNFDTIPDAEQWSLITNPNLEQLIRVDGQASQS